jgi:hypothetical protein
MEESGTVSYTYIFKNIKYLYFDENICHVLLENVSLVLKWDAQAFWS